MKKKRYRSSRALKQILIALMILSLVITMAGCAVNTEKQTVGNMKNISEKEKITIVTSFYPLYVFTENLTYGIANVELMNLTQPQTGCLHDYQMKPTDMSFLEKADIFIVNGAGMESFLNKVMKTYPNLKIIEASKGIPLLTDESGEKNPHVWVSVTNAIAEVKNIESALIGIDRKNESAYRKNGEEYTGRLKKLKTDMHEALRPYKGREIVTFHEAFPYFAEEFGLKIAAVIEREPGSEPSAAELGNTIDMVNSSGVKCLFSEPQYSGRSAEVIQRETGASIYNLDPFVTGEEKNGRDAYEIVMRENLKTLIRAFQ